jgi:spore maturation protein CgeB
LACNPITSLKPALKFYRVLRKATGPIDLTGINKQIINDSQCEGYDVLWLDKILNVDDITLQKVKEINLNCKIVGYSPDDMYAKHNQSRQFLKSLPQYDIYFTTKSYNVKELMSLGCPKVIFIPQAFDSLAHCPMNVDIEARKKYGGPVGFIGTWEKEREVSMLNLAKSGINIRIWGNGWENKKYYNKSLHIEGRAIYAKEYALAICAFDINLCFLRKCNRDLHTTRSIEIPACGAFMLAERTDEHQSLFKEGVEAEFFSSDDELLDKVKYYLAHPEKRIMIGKAGRERCLKSGYSNHDRMLDVFKYIDEL